MTTKWWFGLIPAVIAAGFLIVFYPAGPQQPLRSNADDFTLLDHNGISQSLSRHSDSQAVVIIAQRNGAPAINSAATKLRELKAKYPSAEFWFINPEISDSRKAIIRESQLLRLPLPILMDSSQAVTEMLGLTRFGEAAVLVPPDWKIVFRGPVAELDAALSGQPARSSPVDGDKIRFPSKPAISFEADIAPLLQSKCLRCHMDSFPVNLGSYRLIKANAANIRAQILQNRMPQFSADPIYGSYFNDTSLSPAQKYQLLAWLDAGAPFDGRDPMQSLAADVKQPSVQETRKEPEVFSAAAPEISVPASGNTEFEYVQLGGPVPKDLWVSRMEVTSTLIDSLLASIYITPKPLEYYRKRALTHDFPDRCYDASTYMLGAMQEAFDSDPQFLRIRFEKDRRFAGVPQVALAGGRYQFFIPKGRYLILESHFTGTGQSALARSNVKFFGSLTEGRRKRIFGAMLRTREISIPAGTKSHVEDTTEFTPGHGPIRINSITVHMHFRGRSVRIVETMADGRERTVASIPDYHAGSNTMTLLPKIPIRIRGDSKVKGVCEWDNSRANKYNPDPSNPIRLGFTKSGSEMCNISLRYFQDGAP